MSEGEPLQWLWSDAWVLAAIMMTQQEGGSSLTDVAAAADAIRHAILMENEVEDARIWLLFRRLGNLYGAYRREGAATGIIINAQHPFTLQRYTAAHEYAHHVLGHGASADDDERIQRQPNDLREVAAQSFAGELLMPLQLVNHELRTMGFTGSNLPLTARQLYQLSLEFGVSYRAAVTQLVGQHKITRTLGDQLRQQSPLEVKTSLAGIRPAYPWADVWLLDESQEGRRFRPRLRDEVHVMLAESPSTGYVWQLVDSVGSVLALVDDQFETGTRTLLAHQACGMSLFKSPTRAQAASGSRSAGRGSATERPSPASRPPSMSSRCSPGTSTTA